MAAAFVSDCVKLVRRNRWWLALGASPILLAIAAIVAALVSGQPAVALPALHTTILGLVGIGWFYRRNKDPVLTPGGVTIDDAGVHHGGRLLARRGDLVAGFMTPKDLGFYVRLQRRGARPSILLAVDEAEEGRAILRALGLDASQTAARMRLASQVFAWSLKKQMLVITAPAIAFMAGVVAWTVALGLEPLMALAPLLVMTWVLGLVFSPTRISIGVDGVHTRWLNQERFIPYSRVQKIERYEEQAGGKTYVGVALALTDGERVKIPAGQKGWGNDPAEIEERIREAFDLHRRGTEALDPRLLARGGRDLPGWVATLKALGIGARADMRTPPVPVDTLVRIVEDATASPLLRAAAAVAAASVSPDTRARVRVAAETTASPALRIALERVAADDADDRALAEALGELERAEGCER